VGTGRRRRHHPGTRFVRGLGRRNSPSTAPEASAAYVAVVESHDEPVRPTPIRGRVRRRRLGRASSPRDAVIFPWRGSPTTPRPRQAIHALVRSACRAIIAARSCSRRVIGLLVRRGSRHLRACPSAPFGPRGRPSTRNSLVDGAAGRRKTGGDRSRRRERRGRAFGRCCTGIGGGHRPAPRRLPPHGLGGSEADELRVPTRARVAVGCVASPSKVDDLGNQGCS